MQKNKNENFCLIIESSSSIHEKKMIFFKKQFAELRTETIVNMTDTSRLLKKAFRQKTALR